MKNKMIVQRQAALVKATGIVFYLTREEVHKLAQAAQEGRNGERDELLILTLFQTGLRISEALSLTPAKIKNFEGQPALEILGKGKKARVVACPERLAKRLKAYAYEAQLRPNDRFFPFTRVRGWQIINTASERAELHKRTYPHLLRHSDAIERLRQTGNPKALQHHLGHTSMFMTMRYLSTLTKEDSLRIQQQVEFE